MVNLIPTLHMGEVCIHPKLSLNAMKLKAVIAIVGPTDWDRPPICFFYLLPKQPTWVLESPATTTKSVERILWSNRDWSMLAGSVVSGELQFVNSHTNRTNDQGLFSYLLLTWTEPSERTADKWLSTRIQFNSARRDRGTTLNMSTRNRIIQDAEREAGGGRCIRTSKGKYGSGV